MVPALLLSALFTWQGVAALSLLNMRPASSSSAERDAISNIAQEEELISFIAQKDESTSSSAQEDELAAFIAQEDELSSFNAQEKEAISNIALIPKIRNPIFPNTPVVKSHTDAQVDNPFSNFPEEDISSFLSHIEPVRDHKEYEMESQDINGMKAPNLMNKNYEISTPRYQIEKIQSTCSKYMNDKEDLKSSGSLNIPATIELVTIDLIKSLCEILVTGQESSETDATEEKSTFTPLTGSDEEKSSMEINVPKEYFKPVLYDDIPSAQPNSVEPLPGRPLSNRLQSESPLSGRVKSARLEPALSTPSRNSFRSINGRREWTVLHEEYPGMMQQFLNQIGEPGHRRGRNWGGRGGWEMKMPL